MNRHSLLAYTALASLAALWITWPGPEATGTVATIGAAGLAATAFLHHRGHRTAAVLGLALTTLLTTPLLPALATDPRLSIATALTLAALHGLLDPPAVRLMRDWKGTSVLLGALALATLLGYAWRPLRASATGTDGTIVLVLAMAAAGTVLVLMLRAPGEDAARQ